MKNIVVIFGGRAVEHEVSVITGIQAVENLNKEKYNVIPVFIDKSGVMYTGDCYKDFKNFKNNEFPDSKPCHFNTSYGDHNLYIENKGLFKKDEVVEIDCVLFGVHGSHGEDGALQGIFETNGIPFTGPSVMASAVGMDKIIMKDVYKSHNIPVVKYTWVFRDRFKVEPNETLDYVMSKLEFPIYVKPASLGSSIGIKVARTKEELREATEVASSFDRKIIFEEAVINATELNVAVMGRNGDVEVSSVESPLGADEVFSYQQKYMSEDGKSKLIGGKHNFIRDEDTVYKATELAKYSFNVLDVRGNARIDILMDEAGNMFVNEINTLPGSYAFYLWEDVGYTFKSLLDRMIEIAIFAKKEEEETNYRFDSDLFHHTGYGSKL